MQKGRWVLQHSCWSQPPKKMQMRKVFEFLPAFYDCMLMLRIHMDPSEGYELCLLIICFFLFSLLLL
jgi:hypothetical protein